MNESLILGLNIGGTNCSAVVGTAGGRILSASQWPTPSEGGYVMVLAKLGEQSRRLLADFEVERVGVAIGGPLDIEKGVILSPPNLPGWNNVPLRSLIEKALSLPVHIEHDAAACAFAEYLWGAGAGARRLAYLTCGSGFGVGLVFDGQIYRGTVSRMPEIGHIQLLSGSPNPAVPSAFGIPGSAEALCSAKGLARIASWKFPETWPTQPEPGEVSRLFHSGFADATEVVQLHAGFVGQVCAILSDLLGCDRILLGSLSSYLGETWVEMVAESSAQRSLHSAEIMAAGLGNRLQNFSALAAGLV